MCKTEKKIFIYRMMGEQRDSAETALCYDRRALCLVMLYQMSPTIFFPMILSQRSCAINTSLEAVQGEAANSSFSEKHSRPGAAKARDLFYTELSV